MKRFRAFCCFLSSATFCLFFSFTPSIRALTVTWVGATGDWNTPGNWSGGSLPGPLDDVVISPATNITVTHSSGTHTVHTIQSTKLFSLSGGSLSVTAGFQASNTVTLAGGTLLNTTLNCSNGATLVVQGGTVDGVTLNGPLDVGNVNNGTSLSVASNGLVLNGSALLGNTNGNSGNLSGSGLVSVQNSLDWAGGTVSCTMLVKSNAVLNWTGTTNSGSLCYIYTALTNFGTLNWSGNGTVELVNSPGNYTGAIINQPGANFNIRNDQNLARLFSSEYILNAGTITKYQSNGVTRIDPAITNYGTFVVQSGSVSFNNGGTLGGSFIASNSAAIAFANGNFSMNGMTNAQGNISVTGGYLSGTLETTLAWTGGAINSGLSLTVGSNGVLSMNFSNANPIIYGALTNYGTVNWLSGSFTFYGCTGGPFVNQPGALWNLQGNDTMNVAYCSPNTNLYFLNLGTLQKIAGTNTSSIQVPFTNNGYVSASSGTLVLGYGGLASGSFQGSGAGAINLTGSFDVSGLTNAQGSVFVTGGYISGSVQTSLNWLGGGIDQTRTLTVATNGVLNIYFTNSTPLIYGALTNRGTINWAAGQIQLYGCTAGPLVNQPGAVWNILTDNFLNVGYCSPNTNCYLLNLGTLQKTAGTNTATLSLPFTNSGSLLVQIGTLALNYGNELDGIIQTAPNSGISLNGSYLAGTFSGTMNLVAGTIGTGWLTVLSNGVLNLNFGNGGPLIQGALTNYGTVNWQSGTLTMYGCASGPFINQPGAVWNLQGDNNLSVGYCAPSTNTYFANAGLVLKNSSAGISTLSLPFTNSGTIDVELGKISLSTYRQIDAVHYFGLSSTSAYGGLTFSSPWLLDGTLGVNLANGYVPRAGDLFTLANYPSRTNSFNFLNLPGAGTNAGWQLSYGNTALQLQVVGSSAGTNHIAGTVSDNLSHPVSNITVFAYLTNSSAVTYLTAVTAANGAYSIAVSNGTYQVGLQNPTALGYNQVSNQLVTVNNSSPVVNFTVQPFSGTLYTIATSVSPPNSGSTSGDGNYPFGAAVSLTASANTNSLPYYFNGWTENGVLQSTNSTYGFAANRSRQLVANFAAPVYTITVSNNPPGAGSVSGGGLIAAGTTNTLVATPVFGYRFSNWTESGGIIGTNSSLSFVVSSNRFIVANYAETNLIHFATTASLPSGAAIVTGAGIYTNGQSAAFSAPSVATNSGNRYFFQNFQLNGTFFTNAASFNKTFATTDPTNMDFVASYSSQTLLPQVIAAFGNMGSPVTATTNFVITVRFDRSMNTSTIPQVVFSNLTAGAQQPLVPTNGSRWTTTFQQNDTFQTAPITFAQGMDGSNVVNLSAALDAFGDVLPQTNILSVVIDATSPNLSSIFASTGPFSAQIMWLTDEPANSQVDYGTTTNYGNSAASGGYGTNHSVTVSGLSTLTLYHFRVHSHDLAGNETISGDHTVTTPGAPELALLTVQLPGSAYVGQAIQASITITNSGNGAAVGPWQNALYFATSTNGAGAQFIGQFTFSNSITAGTSATVTQSLILPSGLNGTNYLGVYLDTANDLVEFTRTNNYSYGSTGIVVLAPDLAISGLSAPGSAQFGQSISVRFAITNIGGSPATGPWQDRIYLSTTPNSIGGATLLSTSAGGAPLSTAQGYATTNIVTIPLGSSLNPGTYYIVAAADAANAQPEASEANNFSSVPISLSLPPLPNIAIAQISAPASAAPGQSVQVSWAVTNLGAAVAAGSWREALFLTPTNVTVQQLRTNLQAYTRLGSFEFSNYLAVASTVARTQSITIPVNGPAGALNVAVVLDEDGALVEQTTADNTAFGAAFIQLIKALTLSLPVTNVAENTASTNFNCLVTRNGDLSQALSVSLASSAPNHLLVQANVVIPTNSGSAPFTVSVVPDGLPAPDAVVALTASASSFLSATAQVTVVNTDVPSLTLVLSTNQVLEGESITATVLVSSAVSQPLTINISASSVGALAFPPTVTIPSNSISAGFPVLAVQSSLITPNQSYTLSAAANGHTLGSATVTVLDNSTPVITLALSRTNINEADGPFAAIGTVTRQPVTDQPLTVVLTSSNTAAAAIPAQVIIPGLQQSAAFYVAGVSDTNLTGRRFSLLTAQALNATSAPVGLPDNQLLTVEDNNGAVLHLALTPKTAARSVTNTISAVVYTTVAPVSSLPITVFSSSPTQAYAPAGISIAAGHTNTSFSITVTNDGVTTGSKYVSFTATASGYSAGSDSIVVGDNPLPDLTIASITAPMSGYSTQPLLIGFRLLNTGLAALTNTLEQQIYLTTDAASGNLIPVGSASFSGTLAPGQYADLSVSIPASSLPGPGTYSVVVQADSNDAVKEADEANNLVSGPSVVMGTEYTATVTAGLSTVLSGASVPLSGHATLTAGGPARNKPVDILITLRGLQRVLSAVTDTNGNFSTAFVPLPNEGGIYSVAAVLPGVRSAPAQDSFNILGLVFADPSTNVSVVAGSAVTNQLTLQNIGDVPLSGLAVLVSNTSPNVSLAAVLSTNVLSSMGSVEIAVTATSTANPGSSTAFLHVTSAEGAVVDLPLNIASVSPQAVLAVAQAQLSTTMLIGQQTFLQFTLENAGGAPSGPINVVLPSAPWMSLLATNPLPSIPPGGSNQIALLLSPAATFPPGPVTGSIVVNSASSTLQIPFSFTAVSSASGALFVRTTDEYTFFTTGSPALTNAEVSIINPLTQTVVARGRTDPAGLFFVPSILQGTYEVDASADHHVVSKGVVDIIPGITNAIEAFLSLQAITYNWSVVPSDIEEQSTITIEATFQTDVPKPVVVPTPTYFDLRPLDQPGKSMDISVVLVNNGLIAAKDVAYSPPNDPNFHVDFATTNIGTLPAHSSITLPMRITRVTPAPSPASSKPAPGSAGSTIGQVGCVVYGELRYGYECGGIHIGEGDHIVYWANFAGCFGVGGVPITQINWECIHCGGWVNPISITYTNAHPGTNGPCYDCGKWIKLRWPESPVVHIPTLPTFTVPFSCDDCTVARLSKLLGCVTDFLPEEGGDGPPGVDPQKECEKNAKECANSVREDGINIGNAASCLAGSLPCVQGLAPNIAKKIPKWAGPLLKRISCIYDVCTACEKVPGHSGVCGLKTVDTYLSTPAPPHPNPGGAGTIPFSQDGFAPLFSLSDTMTTVLAPYAYYYGSRSWLEISDPTNGAAFMAQVSNVISNSSDGGVFVTPAETAGLLTNTLPAPLTSSDVTAFVSRWNRTMTNYSAGLFDSTQPGALSGGDFIAFDVYQNLMSASVDALQTLSDQGFVDMDTPWIQTRSAVVAKLSGGNQGTCAEVKIQISQTATLVRDAFTATLTLNNSGVAVLSNVLVSVVVQNQTGQLVTELFGVGAPSISGSLTAVDGTGLLGPAASGSVQWTLIPSRDAASTVPTTYFVSGQISYTDNGLPVTIPLAPAQITAQPAPEISLKYFLQRDVFADDPFTPAIEPSIPFPLAVMVQNTGYGAAHNFRITSAQPTIVENDKGLLEKFEIIGTRVGTQPVDPSLTVIFGDIGPRSVNVGDWLLTSTLQGLFIDYSASFQHVDPLGNPKLSSFNSVEIHEMTHMVRAQDFFDDGLPDFLANDISDLDSLPDTLYLSDGSIQPVSVLRGGSFDAPASAGHLQVQFTANFPAGFTYVQVPDPGAGQFALVAVQRSSGTNLLGDNFYLTDRTFIGLAQPPIRENMLHLFDYHAATGSEIYTLIYGTITNAYASNAPVSSVYSLPAISPPNFGVAWSGAPYVGAAPLAYYDIFVSDNGSPFSVWQSQTTATSALYNGTNGHTYSFYSLATDTAGHRESVPLQPQAVTSVNYTNFAPVLTLASNSFTLTAGDTFFVRASAADPNRQDTLTFSLTSGAPPGMVIDPVTGAVSWNTSPSLSGSTNVIAIMVTDNGQPPLSASNYVTVILKQTIFPPILPPIPNATISEGSLLTFTNSAIESNLPPRTITYALAAGAPTNATLNSQSGVFRWRPTAAQAPSTNHFSITATDNGVPPLSATQSFTVVVRVVSFEFSLSLGSTNLLVGTTNSVPMQLDTLLPLTNLAAVLQLPGPALTNFTVAAVSPEVLSTLLQPLGTNLYSLNINLNPDASPGASRTLARLGFLAPAQLHSSVVPLGLPQLSALQTDGSTAAKPGHFDGRVFIIAAEPILDAVLATNGSRLLTLYGNPGRSYELDLAANVPSPNWQFLSRVPLTNTFQTFKASDNLSSAFYRAYEFSANPPLLELQNGGATNFTILVYGIRGTNYTLLTTTNLAGSNWLALSGFNFTNSFQFINEVMTNKAQFFRLRSP